jgi:hypothetical protein
MLNSTVPVVVIDVTFSVPPGQLVKLTEPLAHESITFQVPTMFPPQGITLPQLLGAPPPSPLPAFLPLQPANVTVSAIQAKKALRQTRVMGTQHRRPRASGLGGECSAGFAAAGGGYYNDGHSMDRGRTQRGNE